MSPLVNGAAFLSAILLAAPPPPDLEARLDAGLASHPAGPDRAVWASGLLVGARYASSPLGEGSGRDADPRVRLDAFDCVTLVETALALGAATSTGEAAALLDAIRYTGAPSWENRNHYVESQWLPALVEGGWLAPATADVAGPLARREVTALDEASWTRADRAGRTLPGIPPERLPRGRFPVDVVPIASVSTVAPRIPTGTVLILVHEERAGRPTRVTHMGIVVRGADGTVRLRHASDVPGVMRVRDEPLDAFLARAARKQWKATGVGLFSIRAGRRADQNTNARRPPVRSAAPETP